MGDTEEYFPRGGKKPTIKYFKQSGNFLGSAEQGEKKKKKQKKKSEADDGYLSDEATKDFDQSFKNCAARLTYKTIKPGVLVLGRIGQVHETKLTVMLPGKMSGTVMACHISEPYNKLLEAYVNDQTDKVTELQEMFRRGQYVAIKVLEVEGIRLMLSMMPQHVNSVKKHTDVHKSDQLQAAVVSVEDHGYVMDIGVANTRPFLPSSNVNPDVKLDVGVITWCTVKSVSQSQDTSIVTLTNQLEALQRASPRGSTIQQLTPGTPLQFTVDKPLDNGIEGSVLGGQRGYVQRDHADKVNGKKPKLGQKIRARVLYVVPIRNTPFLTMRDIFSTTFPDMDEEQKIKEGDIIEEAQVIRILGRTVHFKLGQGCIGTMSLRRIQVDEELTDEHVLAKSYPVGSTHKVRVVSYNLCDYTYTVSDNPAILKEKYFSMDQLSVGQLVDGSVTHVADDHVLLQVGRVTGFVPQSHLSDSGVFVDPKKSSISKLSKKKFKVGQSVRARVLVVDTHKQSVLLTLKPALLAPELPVLGCYERARRGEAYKGCVRIIRNDYMLVSFFNNVTAYVPRQYISREPLGNIGDAFHVGQIVNCTIVRVYPQDKKMTGSLVTEPFFENVREKGEKRRNTNSDSQDVPSKKKKSEESQTEVKETKKKKKLKELTEEETLGDEAKKKRDKKSESEEQEVSDSDRIENDFGEEENKKMKISDEEKTKVSEESDAIETDVYDDMDPAMTPQELELIDISNCNNMRKCKKRVISLLKLIKARQKRIDKIEQKIANIEKKGLNAKNKMFHTAMHSEILVVKQRAKKLLEALTLVQEKLKALGYKDRSVIELSNENQESVETSRTKKDSETIDDFDEEGQNISKKEKSKKEKKACKSKKEDVKVVESLEPVLEVPSAKDFWAAPVVVPQVEDDEDLSSDDGEKDEPKKKRKKLSVAEKLSKLREEEERTRALERSAIGRERPRSAEQFERAALAEPDASELWIAYMAFHLQSTEIEKARAVGRRALSTISFREEQDKLNVWLALLNLENRFGTKESLQKTLEEALQMNEPYSVHSQLLDMYSETSKQGELLALVDLVLRKYRRDCRIYIQAGSACFKLGLVDKARQVMQKAVSVLEKKDHVSVLVQFALLERSHGDRERAEALFEQVLAVYPQRVDVVAVYIDMLLKGGDADTIRQVMERMTSQKLPARKMKTLFKKWIEVEQKIGDEEQVERIRQRAMAYIEKAQF
ncbi:protein RRP5 homolog [Plodia interpunctella]|uniref:protein RRP5 homolog n=1 Tax=Plodia interpunctella TaxID=58824 RepID=UPI002368A167|nr:protein RRP5 homolog [Plodia interpunctella]